MDTMGKAISIAAITAATAVPMRGGNLKGVYVYKPRCAEIGSTTLNKCDGNLSIRSADVKGDYLFIRMEDKNKAEYKFSAYNGSRQMRLMRGKDGELAISNVKKYMVVTLAAVKGKEEEDFSMFLTK